MISTIISTADLEKRLAGPDWVIVDCRFDLANPDRGFAEYQKSHIPGAVYAHLDRDLAGPAGTETGRHPLPNLESFANRLGKWGIGAGKQVVVYDSNSGAYAARLWWMLRFLGHRAAAVLDGGFPKWQQEGRPVRAGVEQHALAQFYPQPDWRMIVTADEVEQIRRSPNHRLIDARAPERFHGEAEPIDPVAGHIPGAVNRFHGSNLSPDGVLLPARTLRSQFMNLLGGVPPRNAVVYCGSGVTSCHHILAMEIAKLPGARLYAGSWSEWISDRTRPTASSR